MKWIPDAMRIMSLASEVATLGIPAVAQHEINIGIGLCIALLPTCFYQELLPAEKEPKAAGSVE